MQVRPTPTDEEAAAIVAAVEAMWPRPVAATVAPARSRESVWRFSGRWWAKPVAVRRDRPFR